MAEKYSEDEYRVVGGKLGLVHKGQLMPELETVVFSMKAGEISDPVETIYGCSLPPAADANLHYVIADMLKGVTLMRGQDPARTRHDGAALVHVALLAYGKYFAAPAWAAEAPAKQ